MIVQRRKNSLRLKGFDYSQPGGYFVTMCIRGRKCILGEIIDGKIILSDIGKILENAWIRIPERFTATRVEIFQIMPNHVHGIIEITQRMYFPPREEGGETPPQHETRRGEVPSPPPPRNILLTKGDGASPVRLGHVVAYFKYEATKRINEMKRTPGEKMFQRNFYDHMIRDDVEWFFIQQYIELNPIMWELDRDNPSLREMPIDVLSEKLDQGEGTSPRQREWIIEHEMKYREWQEAQLQSGENDT